MAYADLIALVRNTLKDTQVTDEQARSFISLAEVKLHRDLMSTQYGEGIPRQMLTQVTGQTDSESKLTVPSDFTKEKSVKLNGSVCRYVSTDSVASTEGYADAAYELAYYQKFKPLCNNNTTNWLLDTAEDVYLWGACLQYIPWGQAGDNLQLWERFYTDGLRTLKQTEQPRGGGVFASMRGRNYDAIYTKVGEFIIFGSVSRVLAV